MNFNNNTLSIRLRSDGFSFAIYDKLEDHSFRWKEVKVAPGEDYVERLKKSIVEQEELLSENYRQIHVTVATTRLIVVPGRLMEAMQATCDTAAQNDSNEALESIFKTTLTEPTREEVHLTERHAPSDVIFGFAIDKDLYNFLQRSFSEVAYHHPVTTLHAYFSEKSKLGNNAKVYAHFTDEELIILIYKNGKLQLANFYNTMSSSENALYYLLNTWAQCNLDNRQDLLQLAGDKEVIAAVTPTIKQIIDYTEPAIFPMELFRLGAETLKAPWDVTLLTYFNNKA